MSAVAIAAGASGSVAVGLPAPAIYREDVHRPQIMQEGCACIMPALELERALADIHAATRLHIRSRVSREMLRAALCAGGGVQPHYIRAFSPPETAQAAPPCV